MYDSVWAYVIKLLNQNDCFLFLQGFYWLYSQNIQTDLPLFYHCTQLMALSSSALITGGYPETDDLDFLLFLQS